MKYEIIAQGSVAFHITQLVNRLNQHFDWTSADIQVRVHQTDGKHQVHQLPAPKLLIFDIEPLSSELQKRFEPRRLTITQRKQEQFGTQMISIYGIMPSQHTGRSIHYICVDNYPGPGTLGEIFVNHLLSKIPELLGFPQPTQVPA